ncbi:hypothetical protein NDU88_003331 [Pleurodeles waltl]|uniref:Uncharacterized protein n=1 Tax=Pleurodeles waltl TaxID=8319 RepID=A0AAV7V0D8_PLEWA|nr:hypothetical protein NDU88_003331 [Pleurodeles waltl]
MGLVGPSWAARLLPDLSAVLPLPSFRDSLWPLPPFVDVPGGTPLPDGARVVPLEAAVSGLSRRALPFLVFFPGVGLAVPLLLANVAALEGGGLQYPCTMVLVGPGVVVAEVLIGLLRDGGGGSGDGKRLILDRKNFLGAVGRVGAVGMGVEEEDVVVGESSVVSLGAGACDGGCREVDGCWVGGCLRLCGLEEGVTDTLGEDTVDV